MSTCPACAADVPIGAPSCPRCGAALSDERRATQKLHRVSRELVGEPEGILETLRRVAVGEYEIANEIGRGGMATVFLAHDIALNRKVAIKVMSPELMILGAGIRERFKREAQTAGALSHPHIIPVHSVRDSGELVYFVMKYIVGRSLESVIREVGPLPIPVVQTLLTQIGSALAYAHRKKVVHRDMKPGNVMLDEEGWAVVTDFGIAKVIEAEALTVAGAWVGTPEYMSPEQVSGTEVTGAADQYSLGIVAFEMLTGKQPFQGSTMMAVMNDHCHTPPPSIREARPDCPPSLADAVARMLEKDPAARFPGMDEIIAAVGTLGEAQEYTVKTQVQGLVKRTSTQRLLEKFNTPRSPVPRSAMHSSPPVPRAGPRSTAPATRQGVAPPTAVAPPAPARSRRWLWGTLAVALLGAATVLVMRNLGRAAGADAEGSAAAPAAGPPVARLDIFPVGGTILMGESLPLTAVGRDSLDAPLGIVPVAWESADPEVATVSPTGGVTGNAPGTTRITAHHGGTSAAVAVAVVPRPAPAASVPPAAPPAPRGAAAGPRILAVSVVPMEATAPVGGRAAFTARVTDGSGQWSAPTTPVRWSSSAPAVADVGPNGIVTGIAPGAAWITASVGDKSAGGMMTVTQAAPVSVELTPSRATVAVGATTRIAAVVRDGAGAPLPSRAMTWQSSDAAVATVAAGLVTAVAPGTTVITATNGPATGAATVTVTAPPPAPTLASPPVETDPRPAIDQVLERYRAALESEDLDQLRTAYPGMTAEQEGLWRDFFGNASQLNVTLRLLDLAVSGARAQAQLEAVYRFRTDRSQTQTLSLTATLERVGDRWRLALIQ